MLCPTTTANCGTPNRDVAICEHSINDSKSLSGHYYFTDNEHAALSAGNILRVIDCNMHKHQAVIENLISYTVEYKS